jgi:peptidoglycan hydrolase-like protein with peptidoglycan-binding domain
VAVAPLPRTRTPESAPMPAPAPGKTDALPRPAAEIVAEIQRELSRRGFYDGPVDGLYGPKTDAAVRDFEQTAGLKPSTEPNESLLRAIARAGAKTAKTQVPAGKPTAARIDPIAEQIGYSRRVLAVQRALAEYGYGQIKPSGIVDSDTQAAIEKFERQRKLPVTGQVSDRVARELAALTGRPLE